MSPSSVTRVADGGTTLSIVRQELRIAIRRSRCDWMFSAAAAVTLALGIGATVATFGVAHGVLLRPLPVRDQAGLVMLSAKSKALGSSHVGLPNDVLWDFAARSRTIGEVAGVPILGASPFVAHDGERAIRLAITATTGNFFHVLGTRAARGRVLQADDDTHPNALAVVLSFAAWMRDFGGDTTVVGRAIQLPQGSYTIVGIAEPEFDYPSGSDAWVSLPQMVRKFGFQDSPEGGYWDLVGRLRSRATVAQARAEFAAFLAGYDSPRLGDPKARRAVVGSYADAIVGNQRPGLLILVAAVTLVLVIAVTNVAGLLVTRGLARRGEFAVRSALGASRRRIHLQLAVEHLVLGLLGGAFGMAGAWVALRVATAVAPPGLARFDHVGLDGPTLAFGAIITVVSIVAFGLAPTLVAPRYNLSSALHRTGRALIGADRTSGRVRQAISVAQLALAIVVLAGAGLLARTLGNLERIDLGFEPAHLLFVVIEQLDAGSVGAGTDFAAAETRHRAVLDGLVDQLSRQPGIVGATPTGAIPFSLVGGTVGIDQHFRYEGQATSDALLGPTVRSDLAAPNYFRILGIRLVRGRPFTSDDKANAPGVAVVNEAMAQLAWPGQDPLGKRLQLIDEFGRGPTRTVVGIAANTRYFDLTTARPVVYVPPQQTTPGAVMAVRTRGDPAAAIPTVKRVLHDLDSGYGISKAVSMPELMQRELARPRFVAGVLFALSVVALLLAAVGLYGVVSLLVRQRAHELGMRLALGATPASVRRLVLEQAGVLMVAGTVLGLFASLAITRVLRALLFEVSPSDPFTLASVSLALVAVATLAALIPAIRASRIDPMVTLRAE